MNAMDESKDSAAVESYWFSKEKLPRGVSYPLKRSSLDSALQEASVYCAVYSVRYLANSSCTPVLDAQFVPLGTKAHASVVGRSLVTLHAVPSTQRNAAEEQILTTALPSLCDWLAKTQTQGDSWRGMPHFIAFEVIDGKQLRAIIG
jgi:hypothetical protein